LAGQAEVGEGVVLARGEGAERQLVAYVVGRAGRRPSVGALRSHLAARLPEHMVPASYVVLESLPLTAHGKVDRRALPEPAGTRPALEVAYAAPEGAVEARLAEVWRQVLGLDRVGRHDNFFD